MQVESLFPRGHFKIYVRLMKTRNADPLRSTEVRRGLRRRPGMSDKTPPGAQGPNFGYWQAAGATRSSAKRVKRP
jgi:hypothetical protein